MSKQEDFGKMTLKGLWQFWIKDWEQEAPTLEQVDTMQRWQEAVEKAIRNASLFELIEAEHIAGQEIDYLEEFNKMSTAIRHYVAYPVLERLEKLEASVSVLLKEHEHEQAKITVGQLNRLKGGMP